MLYYIRRVIDLTKNLFICDLLELYGSLLTEKQARLLEYYYFDDLSLSEIAENEGGSRQGASDMIRRAEKELLSIEERLQLYARRKEQERLCGLLREALQKNRSEEALRRLAELEQSL